jgi:hypothetical protein
MFYAACIRYFLARQDECPESYCHGSGVRVSGGATPQGKNFNLSDTF